MAGSMETLVKTGTNMVNLPFTSLLAGKSFRTLSCGITNMVCPLPQLDRSFFGAKRVMVRPSPLDVYPEQINFHPDHTVCPLPRRLKVLVWLLLSYQRVKLRVATAKQEFVTLAHRYNTSCDWRFSNSLCRTSSPLRRPTVLYGDTASDSFSGLALHTVSCLVVPNIVPIAPNCT